jgi:hypothetical protein
MKNAAAAVLVFAGGLIIAASTVGSIAGAFVPGFVLIDRIKVSNIFHAMGALTVGLGGLCLVLDPWLAAQPRPGDPTR